MKSLAQKLDKARLGAYAQRAPPKQANDLALKPLARARPIANASVCTDSKWINSLLLTETSEHGTQGRH